MVLPLPATVSEANVCPNASDCPFAAAGTDSVPGPKPLHAHLVFKEIVHRIQRAAHGDLAHLHDLGVGRVGIAAQEIQSISYRLDDMLFICKSPHGQPCRRRGLGRAHIDVEWVAAGVERILVFLRTDKPTAALNGEACDSQTCPAELFTFEYVSCRHRIRSLAARSCTGISLWCVWSQIRKEKSRKKLA